MKRGIVIEVSSDEEGFKGSWFRAILEDPLPKSRNKKLNVSLLANDGSTTLKTTYRRFLRPVPPESLFTAAEFEEGCVPEEDSIEDESRKRKIGEIEHNPFLSGSAETESVSSLTATTLNQTEAGTEEISVQPESREEVNNNQMMKTVVLPFAKESTLWKQLETMEVFKRAPPQTPHFRPLAGESEVFRESQALGMILTFSKLLESFKDLEPDVPMSQLDNFKVSFAKLEKHGFDVLEPLAQINKLLALRDKQVKAMEELNGLDRQMMALKDKIVELERRQVALKEETGTAYHNLSEMESCARDRGLVLDNLESEFKATSSAPWGET